MQELLPHVASCVATHQHTSAHISSSKRKSSCVVNVNPALGQLEMPTFLRVYNTLKPGLRKSSCVAADDVC
eukprot:m.208048 g.208048  ORF g.208048 m.208048 type:complete len:71 (+) comp39699_c0_seq37:1563-1775(+)